MKNKILKFKFNNPIKGKSKSKNSTGGKTMVAKTARKKAKKKVAKKKTATRRKATKKKTAKKKVAKKRVAKKKVAKKKVAKKKATKKKAKKRRTPAQKKATARLVRMNKKKAKKKVAKKKPARKKAKRKVAKKKAVRKTAKKKATRRSTVNRKKRISSRNKMRKGTAVVQTWKGSGRKKGKKHVRWEKMLITKRTNPRRKIRKRKNPVGGTMGKVTKKISEYTQHNVGEIGGLFAGGVVHQLSNDLVTKYFPNATAKLEGKLGAFAGSVTPIILGALLTKFGGKNKQVKSLAKGLVGSGIVGLGLSTYEVVSPISVGSDMAGVSYTDPQVMDESLEALETDSFNALETQDFSALETSDFSALETSDFSGTEQDEDYYGDLMGTEA